MRCKNDVYMRKIGVNKIDKNMEVDFDVQRNLPDCHKINTSRYVSTQATNPQYSMYTVPANQFECMNMSCVNSGTLYIGSDKKTIYKVPEGESFSAGVITFYVTQNVTSVEVTLSDTEAGTNAWKYTVTPSAVKSDGYKAVIVDLTQTPTKVGEGWTPSDASVYVGITLTASENTIGSAVVCGDNVCAGLSSIAIFEDMEDFVASAHVKVACLTGIDGSWDLDVAENACFANGYDTSSRPTFEKTITGTKVTANYWRLNPLYKRGSAVEGFDIVTVEKTVQAGDGYGIVVLDDMNQNECGFFSAMLATAPCIDGEATLDKISVPMAVTLDEKHYVLVDAGDGNTNVLFNSRLAGQKVLISYPRIAEVEEFIISADDINEVRTRMSYVKKHTDGFRYRFVFNNVLITSFPDAITEDEVEFEFTVSIQPDANGVYGHAYRIVD